MSKKKEGTLHEITIPERLLLHLLDHFQISGEYTQPIEVTQEGIASGVGVRRSHISYCIKQLRDGNLITEELKHIKNRHRRRKAYSLTQKGFQNAMALKKGLMDMVVRMEMDDCPGEATISQVLSNRKLKLTLNEIIEQMRTKGFVERAEPIDAAEPPVVSKGNIFFVMNVHPCPYFTGRKREMETLTRWVNSGEESVFVVHGIAGIGKTTLGYALASAVREERHLFWFTCEDWTTQRAIVTALGEFFTRMGDQNLSSYLGNTIDIDLTRVYEILEYNCKKKDLLFIFDDTQKLDPEEKDICKLMVKLATSLDTVRFLILSRTMPDFYSPKDVLLKGKVKEMRLEGLAYEDCTALLDRWGILRDIPLDPDMRPSAPPSFETELYEITGGHPLALELVRGREIKNSVMKDITRFFREEVLKTLAPSEESMLELAAIYRAAIPSTGLFLEGGNYRTLDDLLSQSLVKETESGYAIHDVLKGVILGRLVPARKRELHELVSEHLRYEARTGNLPMALESAHHYVEAGELDEAAGVILEFGVFLYSEGSLYDVLLFIDRLMKGDEGKRSGVRSKNSIALLCLKGNLLTFTGELDEARVLLNEVNDCRGDDGGLEILHAKARNGLGIIEYKNGDHVSAIEHYKEAISVAGKCADRGYMAKVLSNLGVAHAEMGELELARNAHLEAMELCWEMDDKEGLARAYNNLGIISFMKKDLDEAITMFKKGLDLSKAIGKVHISVIALNNLGEVYGVLGKRTFAKNYYKEGLRLSRKYDFKMEQVDALEALSELSEGEKSRYYAGEAGRIRKTLGRVNLDN